MTLAIKSLSTFKYSIQNKVSKFDVGNSRVLL